MSIDLTETLDDIKPKQQDGSSSPNKIDLTETLEDIKPVYAEEKPKVAIQAKSTPSEPAPNKYIDFLQTAGRSLKGTVLGGEQALVHGYNQATSPNDPHPFEDVVNQDVDTTEAKQQASKGRLGTPVYIAANIAGQLPIAALLPEANVAEGAGPLASLGSKVWSGTKGGAILGALQPVQGEDVNNQATARAKNAGIGGALGGTTAAITSGLSKASEYLPIGSIGKTIKEAIPDSVKNAWDIASGNIRKYPKEAEALVNENYKAANNPVAKAIKKDAAEYYKNADWGKDVKPFDFNGTYRQKVAESVDPNIKLNLAQRLQTPEGDLALQSALKNPKSAAAVQQTIADQNKLVANGLDKFNKNVGAKYANIKDAEPFVRAAEQDPGVVKKWVQNRQPGELNTIKNYALAHLKDVSVDDSGKFDSDVFNYNLQKFKPLFNVNELDKLNKISNTAKFINYSPKTAQSVPSSSDEMLGNIMGAVGGHAMSHVPIVGEIAGNRAGRAAAGAIKDYLGSKAASKGLSDFVNANQPSAPASYMPLSAIGQQASKAYNKDDKK